MPEIYPLYSGSSGNAIYIEHDGKGLLVDAGVSGKKVLEALGDNADRVEGILVTHEHSDHISSVGTIARKLKIPVYATQKTLSGIALGKLGDALIKPVTSSKDFEAAGMNVTPFSIPHDAADPVGYSFSDGSDKVTIATDIGTMNEQLFMHLAKSRQILLESNHDVKMLLTGAYPLWLKQRIRGKLGHLSNEEAAATCARLIGLGTTSIYLGHLSRENNVPSMAYDITAAAIEKCGAVIGRDVLLKVV